MKYLGFITIVILVLAGCSKDDSSNPVTSDKNATGFVRGDLNGSNWYANKIITSKSGNTRTVKATLDFTNDPVYTTSTLEFKISVSQSGIFGIGEDEPGFQYVIKAYYKLISRSGTNDENYKAYYDNISFLTINRITDKDLDAIFTFTARTDDSLKTVVFTNGSIQINY
ncbi:MAG: hypothetical protein IPJ23_00830 [Ignavibacteriales bacterium]|nr:hypothetical protein [Ignavibacteriales bacterium]